MLMTHDIIITISVFAFCILIGTYIERWRR